MIIARRGHKGSAAVKSTFLPSALRSLPGICHHVRGGPEANTPGKTGITFYRHGSLMAGTLSERDTSFIALVPVLCAPYSVHLNLHFYEDCSEAYQVSVTTESGLNRLG